MNPEAYRQHIRQLGERVRWLKASFCSCYNPGTGVYDRSCSLCSNGRIYREVDLDAKVRVLVGTMRHRYAHPDFGIIEVGEARMTTMPDEIRMGTMDRFVLLDRTHVSRHRVTRGQDEVMEEPYPTALLSVSDSTTVYEVGTDVSLGDDGALVWAPDAGPAAGTVVSVEYAYNPVYWYIMGEETPPRPLPNSIGNGFSPQSGFLLRRPPGES